MERKDRIEERKRLLAAEKSLARLHRGLVVQMKALSRPTTLEASQRVETACWHLGSAIVEVARLAQDLQERTESG